MRRHLVTLALAGLFGVLMVSEASACCHRNKCATPCVATCPAPAPVVATCAPAPAKCGVCGHKWRLFGHKRCRQACVATVYTAPVVAPMVMPSAQVIPSMQAAPTLQAIPTKQMP